MTRHTSLLLVLVLGIIAYSGVWFSAKFDLQDQIKADLAALNAEGFRAEADNIRVEGFPYRLEVRMQDVKIRSRDGRMRLQAGNVTGVSHLWTVGHWVLEVADVKLRADGFALSDADARLSVRQDSIDGTTIAADFMGVEGAQPILTAAPGLDAETPLTDLFLSIRIPQERAESDGLHEGSMLDFFTRIAGRDLRVEARGSVTGPGPLLDDSLTLDSWRDAGGTVEFSTLRYGAAGSTLEGSGSVSLDEWKRPIGSFSGIVTGTANFSALLQTLGLNGKALKDAQDSDFTLVLQNGLILGNGIEVGTLGPID